MWTNRHAWPVILALAGCEPAEENPGPVVTVYRYDISHSCYVGCPTAMTGDLPEGGKLCVDLDPEVELSCTFRPGRDRVRIVARYGTVEFAKSTAIPDAKISILSDGEVLGDPIDVEGQRNGDLGVAIKEFRVPASVETELGFVVSVGEGGFETRTDPSFDVAPAELELNFGVCSEQEEDEGCVLPAAGGLTTVWVDAPRGTSAQVEIRSILDGVVQPTVLQSVALTSSLEPIPVEIEIPSQVGAAWELRGRLGDIEGLSSRSVGLVARQPLEFGGVPADADPAAMQAGSFPARLALEPDPSCRRVLLVVRSSQATSRESVTFTTDHGSLGDSLGSAAQSFDTTFDEHGLAYVVLDLGDDAPSGSRVKVSAKTEHYGTAIATWRLEELAPVSAALFGPATPITVGMAGTTQKVITGRLYAPEVLDGLDDARFSPGTTVDIRVSATVNAGEYMCGLPLPAINIDCDRELNSGGCAWTAQTIPVAVDGLFTFNIPASQCIDGTVTFQARSPRYEALDVEACFGPQQVIEPVMLGDPLSLVFEAEPLPP